MKVVERFVSIQGEGMNIGLPTYFIRLEGCNLHCVWCDTGYAREGGEEVTVDEIVRWAGGTGLSRVCITGGEPLLQEDTPLLVRRLSDAGYLVEVETNGSIDIASILLDRVTVNMDYKLPSSGMEGEMRIGNLGLLRRADQLKFVVADRDDFDRALEVLSEHRPVSRVSMTAVGGKDLAELAAWILDSGADIRIYPQLHRLIWGNERGV